MCGVLVSLGRIRGVRPNCVIDDLRRIADIDVQRGLVLIGPFLQVFVASLAHRCGFKRPFVVFFLDAGKAGGGVDLQIAGTDLCLEFLQETFALLLQNFQSRCRLEIFSNGDIRGRKVRRDALRALANGARDRR